MAYRVPPLYPLPSVNVTCDPREKVIALYIVHIYCSHINYVCCVHMCIVYITTVLSDVEPQSAFCRTLYTVRHLIHSYVGTVFVCVCVLCVCAPLLSSLM